MTDWHTDAVALAARDKSRLRPWVFRNLCSRLVVDPERFPDEREEMESVGMGAVYTGTHDLRPLRQPTAVERAELLDSYFHPYAEAFTAAVTERLAACGRVAIIDLHSYASQPLPYELHATGPRPAVCIGTDDFHTPSALVDAAVASFSNLGEVGLDSPFSGTYVPLRHYHSDSRVSSLMVEVRRDGYLDEADGTLLSDRAELLSDSLAALVDAAS